MAKYGGIMAALLAEMGYAGDYHGSGLRTRFLEIRRFMKAGNATKPWKTLANTGNS
jgi:hypothetical protein